MRAGALIVGLATVTASHAGAQDSTKATLAPVVIHVGRGAGRSVLELPYAVTAVAPDSTRPAQRHLSLDETLFLIPGVSVFNRGNPAQDPRISIRGFGARSSFGVRGIRVMRDGIPLTLPDGQTPVDYLDLENVGRVEVMRGSASSLYGNAGGGVIDIHSAEPGPARLTATAKAWSGDHRSKKVVAQTAGHISTFTYQTSASRWKTDGYRTYSRQESTTGDLRGALDARGTRYTASFEGFETPTAQSPGALTIAQLNADPTSADPLAVRKQAGKIVKQAQFGATAERKLFGAAIHGSIHSGRRSLYNPLTFAVVGVQRHTLGGDVRATLPKIVAGRENRFTSGLEVQRQNDDRRNWNNCTDLPKVTAACPAQSNQGAPTLDQNEMVSSAGLYLGDEIDISRRYIVTASARADAVKFDVKDRLITAVNPNDSGSRTLRSLSPMIGLAFRLTPASSYYWNVSTAFETPTATELGNHADGSAGINQDLRPQRSLTFETGYKAVVSSGLQLNAAIFSTKVNDELVPFEIAGSSGRRYFRNAGRTSRNGVELGAGKSLGVIDLGAAYTYGNFSYSQFTVAGTSFAGKRIPGVAAHSLQASVTARLATLALVGEGSFSSRVFADDANSTSAPGYEVVSLRMLSNSIGSTPKLSVTVGVYNVFNRTYASSVAVNATGGKYFEPGQKRSFYAGFAISFANK